MADQRFNLSVLFKVIDQASTSLRKVGASFNKLGRDVKKAAGSMTIFKKASAAIDAKLKSAIGMIGSAMPLALGAFAVSAVRTRVKFETSMNKVAAITNATGPAFNSLEKQARKLGASTQFSASQAAEAMTFLGMAGLSTEQIMKTLPGTLQLAAAGGLDLASAADLVTNVMTSMGRSVEDVGKINDILAQTAASANTNVLQLGEAFRPVAGFASSAGVSVAQLSAMLGKMADSGERGSIAGTLLRQAFNELLKNGRKMQPFLEELGTSIEDFTDESGKLKNFDVLMKKIGKAGVAPAKIMKAFGRQGGRAILLLTKKGKDLKEFTKTLEESEGAARRMADTMMRGLPGAVKKLTSAFEAYQLTVSETGGFLEMLTLMTAGFFQAMADGESILDSIEAAMDAGQENFIGWVKSVAEADNFLMNFIGVLAEADLEARWFMSDLTDGIVEFFESIPERISNIFGGIVGNVSNALGAVGKFLGVTSGGTVNVAKTVAGTAEKNLSETTVKVLVQSAKGSQSTIAGVERKKGSAKTIVKNTTLLSPFMVAGGRVNQ